MSNLDSFDIDAYLKRIGLGSRLQVEEEFKSISYGLLHAIVWNHATHIPFENLATIYPECRVVSDLNSKFKVSLDPNDIFRKMVLNDRGGFCFEQNLLMARALREFGFTVKPIGARVVNRLVTPDPISGLPVGPFTHLALLVDFQDGNTYLVDNGLGWGGMPRSPLPLLNGIEKTESTGEVFRLVLGTVSQSTKLDFDKWGCFRFQTGSNADHQDIMNDGKVVSGQWFLQYKNKAESNWWDIMHFQEDNVMSFQDAEMGAWYASTNPNHSQTKMVLVALMTSEGRYSIVDRKFTIRRLGTTTEKLIESDEELWSTLDEYFGIKKIV